MSVFWLNSMLTLDILVSGSSLDRKPRVEPRVKHSDYNLSCGYPVFWLGLLSTKPNAV